MDKAFMEVWPIVHGRTQYLDFRPRLLARPGWFTDEDFTWFKRYVFPDWSGPSKLFGARAFPEALRDPGGERWLMLRNTRLTVFGVLAVTPRLSVVEPVMTHEMSRDGTQRGRLLDAFVGFAFRRDGGGAQSRFVPPRDLAPYQLAYEACVRPRWDETLIETRWMDPHPTQSMRIECASLNATDAVPLDGRESASRIRVFPVAEDDRLWRAGAAGEDELSLLLGMPGLQYASHSVFAFVTTREARKEQSFERPQPPAPTPPRSDRRDLGKEDALVVRRAGARTVLDDDEFAIGRDRERGAGRRSNSPRRDMEIADIDPRRAAAGRSGGRFRHFLGATFEWFARRARGQEGFRPPKRKKPRDGRQGDDFPKDF